VKYSELLFLGMLAVFAGATLIGSIGMPFTSGVTFGPGFVPLIMSVAILVLAALIAARTMMRRRAAGDTVVQDEEPAGDITSVIFAIALIAAAVAATSFGSLLAPLGVCMFVITALLLKRSWAVAVVSTLVTVAAIYAIFGVWLHIPIV